jgi:hypothetical protein
MPPQRARWPVKVPLRIKVSSRKLTLRNRMNHPTSVRLKPAMAAAGARGTALSR